MNPFALYIDPADTLLSSENNSQLAPKAVVGLYELTRLSGIKIVWLNELPATIGQLLTNEGLSTYVELSQAPLDADWLLAAFPEKWAHLAINPQHILRFAPNAEPAENQISGWPEASEFFRKLHRTATVVRKTNETDIFISLDLDGQGKGQIETGIGFFDHMIDQVARHGGLNLDVKVKGDLHVDEHHTVEDTALALGECLAKALGDKRGIERYSFVLPMDEALAQVALDFSGRSYLVWEAEFRREKIGDLPTELFEHFFKSFCDTARCTLNIKAEGKNEHHKIEGIFKAFARCIKDAVRRTNDFNIPSTKGVL